MVERQGNKYLIGEIDKNYNIFGFNVLNRNIYKVQRCLEEDIVVIVKGMERQEDFFEDDV